MAGAERDPSPKKSSAERIPILQTSPVPKMSKGAGCPEAPFDAERIRPHRHRDGARVPKWCESEGTVLLTRAVGTMDAGIEAKRDGRGESTKTVP